MWRRNLILLISLGAGLYLLAVNPVSAKREAAWATFKLPVHDVPWGISVHGLEGKPWESASVRACAFTPDSRQIAFLYLTDNQVSEKPWKVVYTSHLALWDFRTGKTEEKLKWDYTSNDGHDPWPTNPRYIGFTADGSRLVLFGGDEIRVLDVPSYKPQNRIAFEYPLEQTSLRGIAWNIVGFSLDPDGSRIAAALSDPGNVAGGFVRVYDLSSGKIIREWKLGDEVKAVAGIALSPDGQRVALSWLPSEPSSDPETFIPSGTDNLRVMDVKTGEMLAGMNTKYFAGTVLFGPNETLLTGSMNDDRTGYKYDTVKIWDSRTGKLLREITNPRTGVHYRLDLSPDGKLLLGYTGTEKPVENFVNVDSQQFQIWDFASGRLIATSPKILPVEHVAFPPEIQISPDGKFVLVSWGNDSIPPNAPVVYEIPQP
jgi:WD40 repeat protein